MPSSDVTEAKKELERLVNLHGGTFDTNIVGLNSSKISRQIAMATVIGWLPGSTFTSALGLILSWQNVATVLTFSGGFLFAIKFLREARSALEAYLTNKSKQKIIIKVGTVTVEIHGANDIDLALDVYSKLAEHQPTTLSTKTKSDMASLAEAKNNSGRTRSTKVPVPKP